jgi:predicted alpha/beta superfamily hydrolase
MSKRSRKTEVAEPPQIDPAPVPSTLTGNFRRHESFHSAFLENTRDVLVYLPPGYDESPERRYPVFYLHDGQNVFDAATAFVPGNDWKVDETAEHLIREGVISPLIMVGVYNTGEHRMKEYTPTPDPAHPDGGDANLHGRFLVEELKPFIDAHYRTQPEGANTGLGGSSLGGLVSLYLALRYPAEFGRVGAMSPSVWWDRRMILKYVDRLLEKPPLRIWLDIGTDEGKEHVRYARQLRDRLVKKGWSSGDDLMFVEDHGAGHTEEAWAKRAPSMLRYLFPPGS